MTLLDDHLLNIAVASLVRTLLTLLCDYVGRYLCPNLNGDGDGIR